MMCVGFTMWSGVFVAWGREKMTWHREKDVEKLHPRSVMAYSMSGAVMFALGVLLAVAKITLNRHGVTVIWQS